MGIVIRQGLKTSIVLYIGVLLGALNNVWLFPQLLSPEEIGVLRLILANELLLATIFQLGIVGVIDHFFPLFKKSTEGKNTFFTFCLIYPLIGLCLSFLFIHFVPFLLSPSLLEKYSNLLNYRYQLFFLVCLITYQGILLAFSRAHYRIVVPSILDSFLLRVVLVVALLLLSIELIDFKQFIGSIILTRIMSIIGLLIYLRRFNIGKLNWHFSFSIKELRSFINYGIFIMLSSASNVVISNLDIIMLGGLIGEREAGIYSIAFFMGTVVEIPRRAISQISIPIISSAWKNNDIARIKTMYQKTSINQLLVGAWLLLLILLNLKDIFLIMPKGEIYIQGYFVVLFIGLMRFIDMAMGMNHEIIIYSRYYRFNLITNLILILIMTMLNLFLIPRYQLEGAAFATLSSIIVYNFIRLVFIYKQFKLQPFTKQTLICLALVGTIALVAYSTSTLELHPIINILLRSLLISTLLAAGAWFFEVSEDANRLLTELIKKIKLK
ncbi:MAG: polysaccharide biosynthesis C-terminal domain-containing protein [Thermonemataceae bacterium]